jgi:predicted PurR-regulated permease PerM
MGMLLLHCFLTVLIAAIMYASGETAAKGVRLFFRRLAGQPGEDAIILAANAVRGVAIGIVGTALIQSILAGIGLFIAGVPGATVLTALILLFCIAQIGPALVMIPVTIWVFMQDQTSWGIFMAVWTLIVGTIDNFIRPFLIKKGADLPLLLIFAGVIGGLISFGLIGLFIGPVALAVTYTLLKEWVNPGGGSPEGVGASE